MIVKLKLAASGVVPTRMIVSSSSSRRRGDFLRRLVGMISMAAASASKRKPW